MNCQECQTQFDDRLDARLSAVAHAAFDAHLADCPHCRQEWTAYATVWETLGQQVAPEPSVGFAERTLRRLDTEPGAQKFGWLGWPARRWTALGFASAIATLALAGWLGYQQLAINRAVTIYSAIERGDDLEDLEVIAYLHELGGPNQL